jgi:hypothetical protein
MGEYAHLRRPIASEELLARAVGGAVVDDHDLGPLHPEVRREHALERRLDGGGLVVRRYQERELHLVRFGLHGGGHEGRAV